jgi:hypothetical protein
MNLSNIRGFRVVYFLDNTIFTSGLPDHRIFNARIFIYITNGTDTATYISDILQPTSNTLPVIMQNNVIDITSPRITNSSLLSSVTGISISLYVERGPDGSFTTIPNNSFIVWSITELFDIGNSATIVDEFSAFQNNQSPFQNYGSQTISDGSIIFKGTTQNVTRTLDASSIPQNSNSISVCYSDTSLNIFLKGLVIVPGGQFSTVRCSFTANSGTTTINSGTNFIIPYYSVGNNATSSGMTAIFKLVNMSSSTTLFSQNINIASSPSYNIIEGSLTDSLSSSDILQIQLSQMTLTGNTSIFIIFQFLAIGIPNNNATCVLEDTHILLANGRWKKVQDLIRGELIAGKDGSALPLCRLIVKDISNSNVDFIVIPKDAIAPGMPMNGLYCCKHHYFLYGDKLYAAESFLSFPGVRRIRGYAKEVLGKELPKLSKLRMYDLQFETEGFYIGEGLLCPSRSPYDADDPLPRELFFDQSLFRLNIPKSQLDHLMGYPVSFERIAMKAKWNWRKFLRKLKERGIGVTQETREEAMRLRRALGQQVGVLGLEYEE